MKLTCDRTSGQCMNGFQLKTNVMLLVTRERARVRNFDLDIMNVSRQYEIININKYLRCLY
jgi:hypothetical protein